jgi:hypothetical protein
VVESFEFIRGHDATAHVQHTADHVPHIVRPWVVRLDFTYGTPLDSDEMIVTTLVAADSPKQVACAANAVMLSRSERDDTKFIRVHNYAYSRGGFLRGALIMLKGVSTTDFDGEPLYRVQMSYSTAWFMAPRQSALLLVSEMIQHVQGFVIPTSLLPGSGG